MTWQYLRSKNFQRILLAYAAQIYTIISIPLHVFVISPFSNRFTSSPGTPYCLFQLTIFIRTQQSVKLITQGQLSDEIKRGPLLVTLEETVSLYCWTLKQGVIAFSYSVLPTPITFRVYLAISTHARLLKICLPMSYL